MSSYNRQTQSKTQNEANARTLRALVKQAENKACVDCKRNDPRWASWNIGCFLCIRCSGIHRSMGTHISKVKSIDLDIWTPEQMASMQKWGNKRCNLYWEAHLKVGHVPPEHKVESFIRSKYEMKRWAKDGQPPSDPAILEDGASSTPAPVSSPPSATAAAPGSSSSRVSRPTAPSAIDLLGGGDIGPGAATTSVSDSRRSASLLDDPPAPSKGSTTSAASPSATGKTTSPPTAKAGNGSSGGGGGLFDLDWHAAPTSPSGAAAPPTAPTKGNKNDILSLFSSTSPRPSVPSSGGLDSFGGLSLGGQQQSGSSNPWGMSSEPQAAGGMNKGAGMLGSQDVWGSPSAATNATPSGLGNDIWGEMTSGGFANNSASTKAHQETKNDAFADIWK